MFPSLELMCQDKIQQEPAAPDGSLEAIPLLQGLQRNRILDTGGVRVQGRNAKDLNRGYLFAVNGSCEITLHLEGSRKLVIAGSRSQAHHQQAIRWP